MSTNINQSLNPFMTMAKNRFSWYDVRYFSQVNHFTHPIQPLDMNEVYYITYARLSNLSKNRIDFCVVVANGSGEIVGVSKRNFSLYESNLRESIARQLLFFENCIYYTCTAMCLWLVEKCPVIYTPTGRLLLNVNWRKMRNYELVLGYGSN